MSLKEKKIDKLPRFPFEGRIDLTYRCNNQCLHCWLKLPDSLKIQQDELSFDEIKVIVNDARAMGCRYWNISGGEPLLRQDFPEIFDYLTSKAVDYTLNTNGTLITPKIAHLFKRKGIKLISLYGATKDVYDHVTRHPGGFDKLMQGIAYLKEAGASFILQLIPMQANFHQWDEMITLAESLGAHWRSGPTWFYLSSNASEQRNKGIKEQRLLPWQVVALDPPYPYYRTNNMKYNNGNSQQSGSIDQDVSGASNQVDSICGAVASGDTRLFTRCIEERRIFHIDPYGKMSWCSFIKDPALRYDLRKGSFQEAWEEFIPSCSEKISGEQEWKDHCGSCIKRNDCRWCAVYAYLETGRYSAPVPYLCSIADETLKYKDNWQKNHRKYFEIAGITIRLESDVNLNTVMFKDELNQFSVAGPGEDTITLRHHFQLPDLKDKDFGQEIYNTVPWIISHKNGNWIYRGIISEGDSYIVNRIAIFNKDYSQGIIYNTQKTLENILKYKWQSLSLFTTDQLWIAPLLADRNALLLHSSAAIIKGKGIVFVGHSDAGKSTTIELLKSARNNNGLDVEILCDDRNIIRKWDTGWFVHGTWSHGTTPDVSNKCAPLHAILFLEQSITNEIIPIINKKLIWRNLLPTLIKPALTAEWWEKELNVLEQIVSDVSFYTMKFDKSGEIVQQLERFMK